MCGRTLIAESTEIAHAAGLTDGTGGREKDSNRPPGTDQPVLLDARPGMLHYLKWGLIPNWAQEPPKFSTIYARIETMRELPAYRHLVGRRHCVFVVNGFYEWDDRSREKKQKKQPYYFRRKDKKLVYLAGLWDTWKDPKNDIVIPTVTMIMQPANALVGQIHDRMGCILDQQEVGIWLNRELPVEERLAVLHPVDEDLLEGWQVDEKMNNARNKDENNNEQTGEDLTLF